MKNKFKKFLSEETGWAQRDPREVGFETDSVLIYDKTARKQKYILNSLREIAGVRIVTVISPTEDQGDHQAVGIRIKYSPVQRRELTSYTSFLKQSIFAIKGVNSVRFLRTIKVDL